jgi:putative FmdB family regulatory protein
MPTYEYRCNACGFRFEAFQSIKEDPVKTCPTCGKDEVERLISAGAGLLFKGSGFYITDYRSDSYQREAKKEKEAPLPQIDTKKTADKKSETKAAKLSGTGTT